MSQDKKVTELLWRLFLIFHYKVNKVNKHKTYHRYTKLCVKKKHSERTKTILFIPGIARHCIHGSCLLGHCTHAQLRYDLSSRLFLKIVYLAVAFTEVHK